ncbi:MAG: homoaconitase large subunit [Candidatus Bathyarchaeia archaeon]
MNLVEKIIASASGKEELSPGEIVEARVDGAMVNDITGPLTVESFRKMGAKKVWDPDKIVVVLDHQVPADSVNSADLHRVMRVFVEEQGIKNFYDVGFGGICHQVMVEEGHVTPESLVVGADSHTCTYGAIGAFGTGIGSTEMAAVFATGKLWFKVPGTFRVEVNGRLQNLVTPKDLILHIIGMIKADGAIYKAIEFAGETISNMSVSGRMTLCNMAVEMGAKTGIVEADDKVLEYLKDKSTWRAKRFSIDDSAEYEKTFVVDVNDLEPLVAAPYSVDNVKPVSELEGIHVDQAFLGSCTNGRLEDLELAARIVKGRRISKDVRFIVQPASRRVYFEALKKGLIEVFIEAGAFVGGPSCGPCFGGHIGLLGSDEVCISSSNRNFKGRMGAKTGKVYLASPATVAASAVKGMIVDPRSMEV